MWGILDGEYITVAIVFRSYNTARLYSNGLEDSSRNKVKVDNRVSLRCGRGKTGCGDEEGSGKKVGVLLVSLSKGDIGDIPWDPILPIQRIWD